MGLLGGSRPFALQNKMARCVRFARCEATVCCVAAAISFTHDNRVPCSIPTEGDRDGHKSSFCQPVTRQKRADKEAKYNFTFSKTSIHVVFCKAATINGLVVTVF